MKPENCLIDSDLQLKIIDFGLSKMVKKREFGSVIMGTTRYLAPEVFKTNGRNDAYKEPLDCWSAGIIMY